MKSKTSKKSIVLRSFLLLPLLAILLAGFTKTKLIEVAPEIEIPLENINSPGEVIQISINGNGQLLIENDFVGMQDVETFLKELNQNLLEKKGTKIKRAKIIVNDNSPANVLADIERILGKYHIAQIDIMGPEIDSVPHTTQEGATEEQLAEYNALAKKYNAITIEERKIPGFELTVLELAYQNMSPKQKKLAQPFPECLPQEGAMKVQLQEYNALARRYNTMIDEEDNIRIKMSDVKRLEYLHGLMSEEQKANAEPFPDFPEPPPPPAAPGEMEEEMIEMEREMKHYEAEMEKQEIEMERLEVEKEKQGIVVEQREQEMERREIEREAKAPKPPRVKKGAKSNIPPPPAPPEPESPLDHVIRMAKKGAVFYLEGKKISSDRAIEIVKNNDEINIQINGSKSKRPKVKISTSPIYLKN